MLTALPDPEIEALEVKLLLEAIYDRHGYDFRDYAQASIHRRLVKQMEAEALHSLSALQDLILREPAAMERLLLSMAVHVTSMFRDPKFYVAFRGKVVPYLRTYPFIRLWHAGCSTGEEVYSMAILLQECGLDDRCRIYATDLSDGVLRRAHTGVFPLGAMKEHTENYLQAGGSRSFSEYYTARESDVIFHCLSPERAVFAQHNLVSDGSINEFNVIFCRNVMIYFNRKLQDRVHRLIYESLGHLGFLALGRKESLRFSPYESRYKEIDAQEKIYQKVG